MPSLRYIRVGLHTLGVSPVSSQSLSRRDVGLLGWLIAAFYRLGERETD